MTEFSLEKVLSEVGFAVVAPTGSSMQPLLQEGRDTVLLKPPVRPLKRGDVILYRRDNGVLVLHRLLRLCNGVCTCSGDAQTEKERGIREEQILGILEGIYRNERFYPVTTCRYRLYVALWGGNLPLRKAVRLCTAPLRWIGRKLRNILKCINGKGA